MKQASARSWDILRCLMKDPFSAMTAQQLARKLGVSERTVRYEIATLSDWLEERGIALDRVPRKGFSIAPDDVARAAELLFEGEGSPNTEDVYLTQDQRVHAIVSALLEESCPPTLADIASTFGVSKTTAARDMRRAKEWFSLHGVDVCAKDGANWSLDVDEYGRRRAMVEYIEMGLDGFAGLEAFQRGGDGFVGDEAAFAYEAYLERAAEALGRFLDKSGESLTDAAYVDLACYLSVSCHRTRHGNWVSGLPDGLVALPAPDRPALLLLISGAGGSTEGIGVEREIDVLGAMLAAAPKMRTDDSGHMRAGSAERMMNELLTSISAKIGYDLYLDEELVNGLRVHIQALFARNLLGFKAKNDLLPNIRERFPELFATCRESMATVQGVFGFDVSDDEVGFVVMYVGAALERARRVPLVDRSVRAVLVCGAGVGTVAFLSRSLTREFPHLQIVAKLSTRGCYQYDYSNVDVVLTTVELPVVLPRPTIRVTPMLSKTDVRKVESFLHAPAGASEGDLVERLLAVVRSTCEIRDVEALENEFRGLLEGKQEEDPVLPGFLSLDELVSEEFVQVGVDVSSWEDAVARASRPLLDMGWMTEDYYQGILEFAKRYEQYGVILAPLCAPHAEPDERNRAAISMVTLRGHVKVAMSGSEVPIGVVMVLCLQTPVAHSAALDELFSLVDEYPDFIPSLEAAKTPAALIKTICEYCRRLRS